MTIRYKCQDCGSVLKIKDELAGSDGRCPKCKREFVVPEAGNGEQSAAVAAPAAEDDADFDPVAFLMDGGGAPSAPPAPAPSASASRRPSPAGPGPTDVDELPPQRGPRRSRVPATESAAASADAMLGGGTASSNAKHLLTRSMEESRVRAAEMPEDEEEPGLDYKELAKLIGLRALPALAGIVVLCMGLYWLSNAWLGGPKLPDLGRVHGVVTRNGEPLAGAQVTFTPLDVQASSATAITDENGEYVLEYQEGVRGAVVGKNRVHVFKLDERGREVIEAQTPYGMGSNEIWVVEPGSQEFNIDTDQPAPAPASG